MMGASKKMENSLNKEKTNIFSSQLMTVFLILVGLIIFFSLSTKGFFTIKNLYNVLQQIFRDRNHHGCTGCGYNHRGDRPLARRDHRP